MLAAVCAAAGIAVTVPACATLGADPPGLSRLLTGGVAADPCHPATALPVPPRLRGQFAAGSSVLTTTGGVFAAPGRIAASRSVAACAAAATAADQTWLGAGQIPGSTPAQRQLATRALLDLKLAVRPDGALLAGFTAGWEYTWPRDASFAAAALATAGHPQTALSILRFLQRVQPRDGVWAARYLPGGSGPVEDGRPAELDASGWVPWAAWTWFTTASTTDPVHALAGLRQLWPMIRRAADADVAALTGPDGLPEPAMDYWENSTGQSTIETAAALLAGLRSATALAGQLGDHHAVTYWGAAAIRLGRAIAATFGRTGYQRTPDGRGGYDTAVIFLAPPFAPPDPAVRTAVVRTAARVRVANGGMLPGSDWPGNPTIAWTPETAFFALYGYANNDTRQADRTITWLAAHETLTGTMPEQVNRLDQPVSVAPLAWTDALVLLSLEAEGHQLTAVPARQ